MYTTSSPVSIPSSARSNSTMSSNDSISSSPREIGTSPQGYSCAWPSWPSGNSFGSFSTGCKSPPSSYISDADLFGDELAPLLEEAPAPPRMWAAASPPTQPLLPLYASDKKRRSSTKQQRRPSKPMEPISESPVKAPE